MKRVFLGVLFVIGFQFTFSQSYEYASNSNLGMSYNENNLVPHYSTKEDFQIDKRKKLSISIGDNEVVTTNKGSESSTNYNELDAVFTKDKKYVYFTKDTSKENEKEHLELFKADVESTGSWLHIVKLPFNGDNISVGYPCLSPDNKTLYFVSDMYGSLGGKDIFKVAIIGDNVFGIPQNLGKKINTSGTETKPYIYNNVLYFASNGSDNSGNFDIKSFDLRSGKARNLDYSINKNIENFGFKKNNKGEFGYFTSGKDIKDNYYFRIINYNNIAKSFKKNKKINDINFKFWKTEKKEETLTLSKKETYKQELEMLKAKNAKLAYENKALKLQNEIARRLKENELLKKQEENLALKNVNKILKIAIENENLRSENKILQRIIDDYRRGKLVASNIPNYKVVPVPVINSYNSIAKQQQQQSTSINTVSTIKTVNRSVVKSNNTSLVRNNVYKSNEVQLMEATNFRDSFKAPVFKGCESLENETESKKCFEVNLTKHIIENIQTSNFKSLGKQFLNIRVLIIVDKYGKSSIKHIVGNYDSKIVKELNRVVASLPRMQAGKDQNGFKNEVKYSFRIPILID